jgi:hypothetical protein
MLSPNCTLKFTRKRLRVKEKSACSQKPVVQIPTSALLQTSWNGFRKSVLTIPHYTLLSKTTKTIKPEDRRYLTSPYIGASGIALPRDHRVTTVLAVRFLLKSAPEELHKRDCIKKGLSMCRSNASMENPVKENHRNALQALIPAAIMQVGTLNFYLCRLHRL